MSLLTRQTINEQTKARVETTQNLPIRVLQIGEGNFLRGFADWMIDEAIHKGVFNGSVAVTQPRASGKYKIDELNAQQGLYTLVTRGIYEGKQVEHTNILSMFKLIINPYEQWSKFLALAEEEQLRFVISNTTEAGLVYVDEQWQPEQPIASFAGKLTALLYKRFIHFNGNKDKGLICLPCELLERNGDSLKVLILRYAESWSLPRVFIAWITESNYFLNSLVDRIVTGYPAEQQAEAWFAKWGYEDKLVTTAEPYHLWVIEGDATLSTQFPLADAGLNVIWVNNLKPYQQRKVAILNGAHTSLAMIGLLQGHLEVRVAMQDETIGPFIKKIIHDEIIATLPYNKEELNTYAHQVFERFMNPFIVHRLFDIAMNSLSKFKTRLLPAVQYYLERDGQLPSHLLTILAAYIRYFKVTKKDGTFKGYDLANNPLLIRDDEVLLSFIASVWDEYEQHADLHYCVSTLLDYERLWDDRLNEKYPNLASQIVTKLLEKEWVS